MRGHVSQRVGTEQVTPTKLGVFCRTEVYEKTARPRTFSPGDMCLSPPKVIRSVEPMDTGYICDGFCAELAGWMLGMLKYMAPAV